MKPTHEVRLPRTRLSDDREEEKARVRCKKLSEQLLLVNESAAACRDGELASEHLTGSMRCEKDCG
jgi:hypothetical protein